MYLNENQALLLTPSPLPQLCEASLPDYSGHGLFNLAVSLARVCGSPARTHYPELHLPDGRHASEVWAQYETVVFLLVDGLGDHFLTANRQLAPNLWRDRVGQLSSVFPSTTATAITTVMTGESATVHGMLGWFVRDELSETTVAPLPMRERGNRALLGQPVIDRLLRTLPMMQAAQRQTHLVTHPELAQGPFSSFHANGAKVHGYRELDELPGCIAQAASTGSGPRYVYAYTPLLDRTAHDFGIDSDESRSVLARIDAAYAQIRAQLPQALIVVAADHGFIDNPSAHQIDLMQHPDIHAMLRGPLSGERRAAYCHVYPQFADTFGAVIEARFGHALIALKAADALGSGLFGPGSVDIETLARCGDWILIARGDWTVRDSVAGEDAPPMIGVHGGLSADEMRVPLIIGGVN
ncbi:alkaline phosphatase family protein [Uliginosibacterium flavum]|uniref:Alkaline phosphatase family protein n=1 Tax=Uliginosibacterium flavum TaxID=1396831 RepID=A0ABV2TQY1_9RHOO